MSTSRPSPFTEARPWIWKIHGKNPHPGIAVMCDLTNPVRLFLGTHAETQSLIDQLTHLLEDPTIWELPE